MKLPAPGTLQLAYVLRNQAQTGSQGVYRVEKYCRPSFVPECFPLDGSSHSTPSQVPEVPSTEPMYRTVHK